MSITVGVKLDPLDVLFFRDGRPFGAKTRGQSGLPMPQTLAGAIWTALLERHGCDFRVLSERLAEGTAMADAVQAAGGQRWVAGVRVRGPWLARDCKEQGSFDGFFDVLVPVPAVLHVEKDLQKQGRNATPLHCLLPLSAKRRLPGWQPPEPNLRPLWMFHREATEAVSGYLSPGGLQKFLANPGGGLLQVGDVVKPNDLFDVDHRTGIVIEPTRLCAQTGLIYGASFLALKPKVCLYAEIVLPDGPARDVLDGLDALPFGGEGRRVRVTRLAIPYRWPALPAAGSDQKPLLLLTTPGIFAGRWKPEALNGSLVAAAVPGVLAVSGWDLARGGPKRTRFAAHAGSVYFLDDDSKINSLNLPDPLADCEDDRAQGWGCYLKGVWTDE